MSKEYTYSMPHSFLMDKAVPVRWRVWAVINGFFIAGKEFWASNDWIGEQICCHKDSVSQGVKELEALGMMHSNRTRRSRIIYPGNGEIGATAYLRPTPAPISDRSERLSISDSNSEKNTSALEDSLRVQVVPDISEEDTRSKKPPKYPHAPEVFSWFPHPEPSWQINTTECKHAELLYLRGEKKVRSALAYAAQHKDDEYFYSITSPTELERKWLKLVNHKPV